MTTYTTTVVSATTIFDFETEATNLLIAKAGGLHGSAGADVVTGTEDYSRVTVNGEITSDSGNCIDLQGHYSSVSIGPLASVSSNSVAMTFGGTGNLVDNFGHISGAWGITVYGGTATINNYGSIVGTSTGDYYYYESGVYLVDDDDDSVNSVYRVVNSGTISGNDYAIYAGEYSYNTYYASDTTVINSGLLVGGTGGAVFLGLGVDQVFNTGTINGDVLMGGDADLFDGRGGTVNGTVFGGAGDDTFIIDDTGIELSEAAAEGTDTVKSKVNWALGDNFENLKLIGHSDINGTGNSESNVMTGNSGDNLLRGGGSSDIMYGGSGDDTLRGNGGNDTLNGGFSDDMLRGGRGNDKLVGGDGNDVLVGGVGRDVLTGGADSDTFRFIKAADSQNSNQRDKITDFTQGEDVIDLARVTPGTLSFIGTGAFTATGQGEVRYNDVSGDGVVRVDVDGDGSADMKILVSNFASFVESDFLL